MNITYRFAQYLASQGFGVLGTNLFVGAIPKTAPSECYWVTSAGGTNGKRNKTGERIKMYNVSIYFRSTDPATVEDKMELIETTLNSSTCPTLTDYDTISIEAFTYPSGQQIDSEKHLVGLVEAKITTYF